MSEPVAFESRSPRHGLPFLFAGQAQKEFFVNEALARLDLLAHPAVEGEAADPPPDPRPGECWIVGSPASGDWSGQEGRIAGFIGGAWTFADPAEGMAVWDRSNGSMAYFRSDFVRIAAPAVPSGGPVVDGEARTAIEAIIEALRNAGIFSAT